MKQTRSRAHRVGIRKLAAVAVVPLLGPGIAHAYKFNTGPDWTINLDTSVQYTIGMRMDGRNADIGNNPGNDEGDYKFDKGDLVTNRLQGILEFGSTYQDRMGFRASGTGWKDFAYDDDVKNNPNDPAYAAGSTYPSGEYSGRTKKYHIAGGQLLDSFVWSNFKIGDTPAYIKVGRLSQQWGNGLFFGFAAISYSQQPTDFIKGFSQPGSEVKELFLPRTQVNATAELSPELSVSAQYFLEYASNRYPEGGTYLAPSDLLYEGPPSAGIGGLTAGKAYDPKNVNNNFGVKAEWSPTWAGGDLGFYFRKLDEVQPWTLGEINDAAFGSGDVHLSYATNVNLYGISYERTFGPASVGTEVNMRTDTALNSAFFNGKVGPYREGARGDIVNVLVNAFLQLGSNAIWDTGVVLGEVVYTHLDKVTENADVFNGKGYASCVNAATGGAGGINDGCATKNSFALSVLFNPQWLQVLPSWDFAAPISGTFGIAGNPAYAAGAFYAQDSIVWSAGVNATYRQKYSFTLQYQDYYWNPGEVTSTASPLPAYSGGNGPFGLNDKGWLSLSFKTSF
ncbi:MAG: hypothetical protein JWQ90_5262 [Hydrocarboniphaga sp.]|uniref:DUF1302 domain-containing protein n=1 Tax=Hydrocarboniphaga sp. TaxID=2033016 RepID=UPI00260B1AE8|nr:DUF1302 family protein [Hydrocarboniphaga sp.]MDB5972812.1 hypothetical protein [Hydrocarboniphaga sp.]